MKVFKFGGACIQYPEAVRKLAHLIQSAQSHPLVVVVSAMDKTTSGLEKALKKSLNKQPYGTVIQNLYAFHQEMIDGLLCNLRQEAYQTLTLWQEQLMATLDISVVSTTSTALDKLYSKIVAEGELLASKLIYYYLQEQNVGCTWLDARKFIKTDSGFCNAQVDWVVTRQWSKRCITPFLNGKQVVLTQGFIGSNEIGDTTTLGKEGSDFTGAILASVLSAQSLTIWKDVPGIMNADPKLFQKATKFDHISYKAVAEMAFYGAKVLHPKTVQPLVARNIPLYIKPFHHPHETGTEVANSSCHLERPVYILQRDQGLVHLSMEDLAFFDDQCLEEVLHQLTQHNTTANMLDKNAYTLSMCLNADFYQIDRLLATLSQKFKVRCHAQVHLLTIIHQDARQLRPILPLETILLEKKRGRIYQVVFQQQEEVWTKIWNML